MIAKSPVAITDAMDSQTVAGGGVFVHYDKISEKSAQVYANTEVRNDNTRSETVTVETTLTDADGKVLGQVSGKLSLKPGEKKIIRQQLGVKNPKLWSPDAPYLYRLQSRVKKGTRSLDGGITRVGIRLAEFRGKDGFWLNGKPFGQLVGATGFAKYNGYWWRVVSGKVNFSASGIYKFNGYWWYTKGGHIDMSYNGVAQYNGYWWKFKNGYIDFKYTGLGRNQYGWWYVSGGRVNFKATGLCKYNGSWWYINNGKLDFNYTGLTRFNGSWWYVKGGYVRFDYTGTVEYGGSWWYVKSGRIDFSYNGDANVNGMTYHVSNGKVTGYASKLYTVTDPNSDMYGQTLKLYYSPSGELVEDVSDIIGSGHTYELHVNKTENIVTVYTTDGDVYVPVKRFICSNGGSNTPEGTFYSPDKYRWWELMGPCWGQWCTRITGGVLFHSVFYNSYQDPQSLSVRAYNKLGTTCSHGCVRLTAGDAKWIYDNCASGVKIVVYSKDGYEPFSKPTSYQLPSWHTWDPTDPTMYYKCQENGCH